MWDNGGRNIKLEQAEFIDISPLIHDSRFNVGIHSVKKGNSSLFGWWGELNQKMAYDESARNA